VFILRNEIIITMKNDLAQTGLINKLV